MVGKDMQDREEFTGKGKINRKRIMYRKGKKTGKETIFRKKS